MEERILTALKGSVEKWRRIVNRDNVDRGSGNCPLCLVCKSCFQCPVFEKTRKFICEGTPYSEWSSHHKNMHESEISSVNGLPNLCPECTRIAVDEMMFLCSLLPKNKENWVVTVATEFSSSKCPNLITRGVGNFDSIARCNLMLETGGKNAVARLLCEEATCPCKKTGEIKPVWDEATLPWGII